MAPMSSQRVRQEADDALPTFLPPGWRSALDRSPRRVGACIKPRAYFAVCEFLDSAPLELAMTRLKDCSFFIKSVPRCSLAMDKGWIVFFVWFGFRSCFHELLWLDQASLIVNSRPCAPIHSPASISAGPSLKVGGA